MKKNILFLLQEHNSIDQITPLIEVLNKSYNIYLIKTLHKYNYKLDNNLKYLISNHSNIVVKDLFFDKNYLYKILHDSYNYLQLVHSRQRYKIFKLFYYILSGVVRRSMVYFTKLSENESNRVYECFNPNNTLLVTEITNGDYNYTILLKKAKELGFINIAFTHGFDVLVNELLTYKSLTLTNQVLVNDATIYSDKMVVFNSLAMKRKEGSHSKKLMKLPSLRFTTYWIEKIQDSQPFHIDGKERYKLKIVFMLSAARHNIWEDEQLRTIKALLLQKDIYLVLKVHPRDIREKNKFLRINQNNFKVVDNSITSSKLIEWSDIVMTIGSGIIIEAIIRNKISFYLKYLHCNKIELEETKNIIHQIETRDELLSLINKYKTNLNNNYIDQNEKRLFLKDYILNDDFEENEELYLELFRSL